MKKTNISVFSFTLFSFFSISLFAQEGIFSRIRILKKNQDTLNIEAQEEGTLLILQGAVSKLRLKLKRGSVIDTTGMTISKKLELSMEEKQEPGSLTLNQDWSHAIESIFPVISEDLQASFPDIQKERGPSKITIEKGENCLGYFINIEPSDSK